MAKWTSRDTAYVWRLPIAVAIGLPFILFLVWLTESPTPQKPWECHPRPGYCSIDWDWRPPETK